MDGVSYVQKGINIRSTTNWQKKIKAVIRRPAQGTKFISLNMLINGARSCPDRVVDILEACGALDLSSSLSRDVIFISVLPFFLLLCLFIFFIFSLSPFFLPLFFLSTILFPNDSRLHFLLLTDISDYSSFFL